MSEQEKKKIIKLYCLLQSVVFTIDDLQSGKVFFHKSKQLSSDLIKEITRQHGNNISSLWKVPDSEFTIQDILAAIENLGDGIGRLTLENLLVVPDFIEELHNGNVEVK